MAAQGEIGKAAKTRSVGGSVGPGTHRSGLMKTGWVGVIAT